MANRPILKKKLARLRKATQRTPLPAYIDLIRWLKDRRHANTTGEALRLLVDGKVRSESHVVGRRKHSFTGPDGEVHERWEPVQFVPANLRDTLRFES